MTDRNKGKAKWEVRRKIIISTLIFCAGCVLYIMILGPDNALMATIVTGCFSMATMVISGYIFGAVIDDKQNETASAVHDLRTSIGEDTDERP